MTSYRVEFTRTAEKELGRLPRSVQARFIEAIDQLQQDAVHARSGVDIKRLRGGTSLWRLRVGDYRALYELEGRTVVFTRFGHRSKVYDV